MQVTRVHLEPAEPAPTGTDRTGSPASTLIAGALALVREWAPGFRAVLLGGSHAGGDAAWIEEGGRSVTLSDLDLLVVVSDAGEARAAEARARAGRAGLARRCFAIGLAAPLEAGFHAEGDLARLPARPATLELKRHGRVIAGDARMLERVPDHAPRDITREEAALLIENRGCELLWCWPLLSSPAPLDRLRGRHALLKCALDLAGAAALADGEWPDGAAARVARARGGAAPELAAACGRLWDRGLAWRSGVIEVLEPAASRAEWREAAAAWVLAWRRALAPAGDARGAEALALTTARRARLRRRLRQALDFHARGGPGPTIGSRVRHALDGTPQHRVNGSAALLLARAPAGVSPEPLAAPARAALRRLGVIEPPACADWERARAAVVRAWDRWLLDGQRTAEPA